MGNEDEREDEKRKRSHDHTNGNEREWRILFVFGTDRRAEGPHANIRMETRAGDSSLENQHHGEVPGSSKSDSSPSGSAVDEAETRVSLQGRLSVQESLELLGKETSPGEYGSSRQCTTATDELAPIGTALRVEDVQFAGNSSTLCKI